MSDMELPFGEFVRQRREALGISQKDFAGQVKISPAYLSDIEKGNRPAPEKFLEKFASVLRITSPDDLNAFFDMAGVSQNGQHSDINSYIGDKPKARLAFRTAKENGWGNEDWQAVIEMIQKNSRK